jgi:SAM-dependent methyltransferase
MRTTDAVTVNRIGATGRVLVRAMVWLLGSGVSLVAPLAAQPHGHAGHHRVFDDPAAYTESWDNPERDAWQRPAELVTALGVTAGMTVADIGTGTGYLLPHLSRAAGTEGRVLAVDISPQMLEWVADRAAREGLDNIETVQASGAATGLPAATVDRAIMINVWHHIEDPAAYARDLYQVMRAGGVVLIVEAKPDWDEGRAPPRHFRLQPEAVMAQLEQAGFNAVLDTFEIDRQYVVRAER